MNSLSEFAKAKANQKPITLLTCYDAPSALIIANSSVDAILVGDSAAMVVHGHDSTLPATIEMIETHVRAVRKGLQQSPRPNLIIIADMPFLSTRLSQDQAVEQAGRLMRAGANAVKIEGLVGHESLIPHLVASGIPVMGHLGLQPQSVQVYGSYRVVGKQASEAEKLLSESLALQSLGCFSLVIECVPSPLAAHAQANSTIPIIGIGAGKDVAGQVLVWHDLLGVGNTTKALPRFVRRYAHLAIDALQAIEAWVGDIQNARFPLEHESYGSDTRKVRPQVFEDPLAFAAWTSQRRRTGTIGFIPTMGALHAGHASLVERSLAENDFTVLSIFVNPTQFNAAADLASYPRTLEADLDLLGNLGVDAVFCPNAETIYPDKYRYSINESEFSKILCGAHRPGHFEGVLTVVMKLFQLSNSDRAYFGEKDWQQLALIRGMVQAYFIPIKIIACPIKREESGLAMSSRNVRLSTKGLELAAQIYNRLHKSVHNNLSCEWVHEQLEALGFEIDYVTDLPAENGVAGRRLLAVYLEGVRLIDNVPIIKDGQV